MTFSTIRLAFLLGSFILLSGLVSTGEVRAEETGERSSQPTSVRSNDWSSSSMPYPHWTMPVLGHRAPSFPYLPGDDRDFSRSIGGVVHGHLVESRIIPQPHPDLAFLEVQYERGLFSTTDRMLRILEGAADHLRRHYPESVVRLGNQSASGGGDIPYSASHNSGRDADLGFFLKGPDGEPAVPDDLLKLDEQGRYDGKAGTFRFDTARNWRLVEGVIEAAGDQLQYIFISRPLRQMLLERAREVGADASVRRRARRVLRQPRGALPHNDHFHVRVYCSEVDVASGCWDRGSKWSWYDSHRKVRRRAIERAERALGHDEPRVRRSAARRLALLEGRRAVSALADRLDDSAPEVRTAAARALADMERGLPAMIDRLTSESHPRAYAEIIDALGRLGGRRAARALTQQLDEPRQLTLNPGLELDARTLVAESLIRTEQAVGVTALLDTLEVESPEVRESAGRALRHLTNHDFGFDWRRDPSEMRRHGVAIWRDWYRRHRDIGRDRWLIEGFERAGFEVDELRAREVWSLCRAVAASDHLSHNAQRILMRISGRQPASLSWLKHDAHFYWRRWFERRYERFGLPPIPDPLSTLDDS